MIAWSVGSNTRRAPACLPMFDGLRRISPLFIRILDFVRCAKALRLSGCEFRPTTGAPAVMLSSWLCGNGPQNPCCATHFANPTPYLTGRARPVGWGGGAEAPVERHRIAHDSPRCAAAGWRGSCACLPLPASGAVAGPLPDSRHGTPLGACVPAATGPAPEIIETDAASA